MSEKREQPSGALSRRGFFRWGSSLAASVGAARFLSSTRALASSSEEVAGEDYYQKLGVPTIINAAGTYTTLTAACMPPVVLAAVQKAALHPVRLHDLQVKSGEYIARRLQCEGSVVTSGAAGAITLATAACLQYANSISPLDMPQAVDGLKKQVIVQQAHRYGYDHAIFLCGARVTEVVTLDDYKRACAAGNAIMTNFFNAAEEEDGVAGTAQIGREEWLRVAHEHNIPCHLDAAADMPPISNLWKYTGMGFDLVAFSGGKGMRGPQNAGLLLGKKHLTDLAQQNNNPNEGVGRGMKVAKEQIVGMVAAVDWVLSHTEESMQGDYQKRVDTIVAQVKGVPGVTTETVVPKIANHVPHLLIRMDPAVTGVTTAEIVTTLRDGKPSIELNPNTGQPPNQGIPSNANTLVVGVWMLQPGEDLTVGRRIREALTHKLNHFSEKEESILENQALSKTTLVTRRDLLKQTGMLSAVAVAAPLTASAASLAESPAKAELMDTGTETDNIYTRIGLRPIVNARGTFTIISGSQSLPEVKQAMFEASHHYVQMDEMMAAVGAEIALHMGAPSAIVTTGCEAAIATATVACIAGTDVELAQAMPYVKTRNQVIIPKYSRNPYDFGIRMSGPEIVEVETDQDLRSKINEHTAMIYVLSGPRAFEEPLSIKTVCAIAKEKNIPVFVDAAAEEPLVPNIHLAAGATFVAYSGGKCMRGPQAAGVLLGPKDLCAAAFWNAAPHHNWGRALKVGKEEAMGMLAAVHQWYKRDHDAEQKQWRAWDESIIASVKDIPSVTTEINGPDADLSNRAPVLTIHWDAAKVGITGTELIDKLDKGTPRILVAGGHGSRPDQMASSISIMPYMMQPGDHTIVAEALSRYMRNPGHFENPPVYSGPTANLAGTWDVTIQYVRGVGKQTFTLQQDGKTLSGEQKGQIFNATLQGKVDADHVKLSSVMPANGYEIHFTFNGVVSGNQLSGDVSLGEYGPATFTATKA